MLLVALSQPVAHAILGSVRTGEITPSTRIKQLSVDLLERAHLEGVGIETEQGVACDTSMAFEIDCVSAAALESLHGVAGENQSS